MRLETLKAVQHNAQWRLQFEPQTQSLVLHSIKTRRGDVEVEHASLEKIRFLQREAGLEGLVIDGYITLLLILEDVVPGDIVEYSYTVTNRPRLMPEHFSCMFALPAGAQVGRYHFSVRHAEQRNLKWKSSSEKLTPKITTENGESTAVWLGVDFSAPALEDLTPIWHVPFPWIQVSDCPDWQTVACGFSQAWAEEPTGEGFKTLLDEINGCSPDLLPRINRAIKLIQDGFRYLAVDIELGGQIPAPADTVIRRRYGDCKNLAFLLVRLLRALGVSARPVLVNTLWRKSIEPLLPAPGIFNHAIVEFQVENEKRWVDATSKCQGGGALNRCVLDFGFGLPIDPETTALAPVPAQSLPTGKYELKESFILDTAGNGSYLAVQMTTTGFHADAVRWDFENQGVEIISKKRSQMCANKFSKATRLGPLQFRDDRELNEFVVAEVFEISGFLKYDQVQNTCLFFIQSEANAGMVLPSLNPRRNPFALPFPCNRVHTVEIDFTGMDMIALPVSQEGDEFFTFSRRSKGLSKFFKVTFSYNTLADCVPVARLLVHRTHVEAALHASAVHIRLPRGYARMRKRSDFGALPGPARAASNRPTSASIEKPPAVEPEKKVEPAITAELFPAQAVAGVAPPAADKQSLPAPVARAQFRSSRRRSSRGQSRENRIEQLGVFSFFIFLFSFLAIVIQVYLHRKREPLSLQGLMFFSGSLGCTLSIVLAVMGLRKCIKYPSLQQDSKLFAILTLVFGGLFELFLIWALIGGIRTGIATVRTHRSEISRYRSEPLDFKSLNFIFHQPQSPWQQLDAGRSGHGPALYFGRPGPIFFSIGVHKMELPVDDPQKQVVTLAETGLQNKASSYKLVDDHESTYNGVAGWQIETQAAIQGHDFYFVQWVFATNGLGYQLATWGPPELKSRVQDEAAQLNRDFELVPPQN